jgi:hypothetical protein
LIDPLDVVAGMNAIEHRRTWAEVKTDVIANYASWSTWNGPVAAIRLSLEPSEGRLLRIDADDVKSGEGEGAFFSHLPPPPHARLDPATLRRPQGPRSGLAAIMGQWPGDETDDEIAAALEKVS